MIKKILIIRFSALGDTLLCTPIVRCLKDKGTYEVHFLTKKTSAPLLEKNPHIDRLHLLKDSIKETIRELKKENFDFVVDLHKNPRSLWIRLALGHLCCNVGSYPKLIFRRFLCIQFHWKKVMPKIHLVERYFEAVRTLGVSNDKKGLELFNIQKPLTIELPKSPFIGIAVGSKHFTKQIPIPHLVELCNTIAVPIVLLGDANDKVKAQAIVTQCPSVLDACGSLSLAETAYTIQKAHLLITGDSALMHIAAALDKNLISVWGSTIPEFGMYPYFSFYSKTKHLIFENKDLDCRPCHKHGCKACPKKHFACMESLDYNKIATEVNKIVSL